MAAVDRVLVLAGGLSYEREVSLQSGRRVVDALASVGIEAQLGDTDATLLPRLAADPPDAVFVALHGGVGEDGSLRGVLELFDVPFVGAGSAASRLAHDKVAAKAVVATAGVRSPAGVAVGQAALRELGVDPLLRRLVSGLGLPLVVKPAQGGSAMGVSIVRSEGELPRALAHCFSYADTALVELLVAGTEVAVGVVDTGDGPQALPAVEIVPHRGIYDYAARYTAGETEFHVPARLSEQARRRVAEAAVAAHRALDLRELSRSDFIVTADGEAVFLEASVSPGLTETSTLPMGAAAAGLEPGPLFAALLDRAVRRSRPPVQVG